MKKPNWILVILAFLMAGTITVACGKDGEKTPMPSNQSTKEVTEQTVVVGYSRQESLDIDLLIPKEQFLLSLENYLNAEEDGRYVAEDIKVWHEEYGDGQYTPLMSVSYFDLNEEKSTTVYINLDMECNNGKVVYTANGASNAVRCEGKCNRGCHPEKDGHGRVVGCQQCTDVMPMYITPYQQSKWMSEHYCREQEPSLREFVRSLVALIRSFF